MILAKPDDAPVQKLFDLTGKVVAITGKLNLFSWGSFIDTFLGGGRGIGLAVATAYAEAGAEVCKTLHVFSCGRVCSFLLIFCPDCHSLSHNENSPQDSRRACR